MKKNHLPKTFVKNITALYGNAGTLWLLRLPEFLSSCEQEWSLRLQSCFPDLSFNYAAPGNLADGNSVVLKCSPPNPEFHREIAALTCFNGNGAVKLLKHNATEGKILLEHLVPGHSLETLKNTEEAVRISVVVMRQLHHPVHTATTFPTLAKWLQGFDRLYQKFSGGTGPFPAALVDQARGLGQDLLASMSEPVLLHGDLHYGNILYSEATHAWLAIDPKGVIGEREYEIPLPKLTTDMNKQQLQNNLTWFISATGFDAQRVLSWLFVKAMLAAWWSFEDSGKIFQPFLTCAEIVRNIKFS